MKRLCTFICAMLLGITMYGSIFTVNGIKYGTEPKDNKGGYYPIGFEEGKDAIVVGLENTSYSGKVIIPESVNYNGKTLIVKFIGANAFNGCVGITSISIGSKIEYIEWGAFGGCTNLVSFNLPSSVEYIGEDAFNNTAWYNNLPDGLIYKDNVLLGYKGGQPEGNLEVQEGTRVIASSAFAYCRRITSVKYPSSLITIGQSSFFQSGLTSVTIPRSVKLIDYQAFHLCRDLIKMEVEDGNTTYDSRNNCNAIIKTTTNTLISGCQNTIIPNTVTSIASLAFRGQYNLESIVIPNSVTSIGGGAFSNCGLKNVYSQIKEPYAIDGKAEGDYVQTFTYNDDMTLYVPMGTKGKYQTTDGWKDFKNIMEMEPEPYEIKEDQTVVVKELEPDETGKVDIPEKVEIDGVEYTVTEIAEAAFKDNTELTEVTIPGTVTTIGAGAFEGCTNLKAIYVLSLTPASMTPAASRSEQRKATGKAASQFEGIDFETCVLYVPFGSEEAYREADGWKEFKQIIGVHGETDPALTVKVKSYTREYGEENPVFEFTTEGAALDGEPVIECGATTESAVGTYDIIVKKGSVKNYNDTYVKGTLTITKAPLKVSVKDVEREQGEENPQFELVYEGWKLQDTESVLLKKPVATTTATKDSKPGTYPITVSGGEARNYELRYVNGRLTVTIPSSINELTESETFDVYDMSGRKVRRQTSTLKDLPKGVYVVNGRKLVAK